MKDWAAGNRIDYAVVKKNPGKVARRAVCLFNIKTIELTEEDGNTVARLGGGDDIMFAAGRFESDFVQGNRVDVCGYLAGPYTYESQAGWVITLPSIAMVGMTKPGGIDKMRGVMDKAKKH